MAKVTQAEELEQAIANVKLAQRRQAERMEGSKGGRAALRATALRNSADTAVTRSTSKQISQVANLRAVLVETESASFLHNLPSAFPTGMPFPRTPQEGGSGRKKGKKGKQPTPKSTKKGPSVATVLRTEEGLSALLSGEEFSDDGTFQDLA
jgi:hypothetical protein